jgi:hypothetical protein
MRNSTKKITAIAAALLLSVSTVATTATMVAPAVFADVDGTIDGPNTAKLTAETTGEESTSVALDGKLYIEKTSTKYDITDTDNGILKGTYNFGAEITPLEKKDVEAGTVTLYVGDTQASASKVYYKLSKDAITDISYANNTEAGNTATVTITIDGTATKSDDSVINVSGTYTTTFTIAPYALKNAKLDNVVTAAWNGSQPITINASDFKLYTEETAADNKTKYKSYIDTSLYTIADVFYSTNTSDFVSEKDGVVTITPTGNDFSGNGFEYKVTFGNVGSSTNFTESVCETALYITRADWNNVTVEAKDQVSESATSVTVKLNGYALSSTLEGTTTNASLKTTDFTSQNSLEGKAYAVYAKAVGDSGLVKVIVTPNADYFENATPYTTYVNIGKSISSNIKTAYYTNRTNATYTYTGSEIKPDITVTAKTGVTLTEGVDYEIVYENNVNVNNAGKATIQGIGDYAGTYNVPGTFKITAAKLADTTVTATDVTYETTLPTLADLAKAITVKNGDTELVYGEDFTVVVSGKIAEGANTLKIFPVDGNTNYTGSTTATVNVVKVADISTAEIATIANVAYTGEAQTPALKVTLGDKELVEGTDYTVAYTNNTEVGCATATITGIGAYTGTNARNFVIVPQQVTGLKAVKKTATTLKLQFNAVEGADGYKIYDAETGKAIASVSTQNGADVLKKTITGLNAGETRKYKVRAYKIVNGTKRYAEFSAVYTKATAKK